MQEAGLAIMFKKEPFGEEPKVKKALRRVFSGIRSNLWLLVFMTIGASAGVALGIYLEVSRGMFVVAIGSVTGLIGHLIDSRE